MTDPVPQRPKRDIYAMEDAQRIVQDALTADTWPELPFAFAVGYVFRSMEQLRAFAAEELTRVEIGEGLPHTARVQELALIVEHGPDPFLQEWILAEEAD